MKLISNFSSAAEEAQGNLSRQIQQLQLEINAQNIFLMGLSCMDLSDDQSLGLILGKIKAQDLTLTVDVRSAFTCFLDSASTSFFAQSREDRMLILTELLKVFSDAERIVRNSKAKKEIAGCISLIRQITPETTEEELMNIRNNALIEAENSPERIAERIMQGAKQYCESMKSAFNKALQILLAEGGNTPINLESFHAAKDCLIEAHVKVAELALIIRDN